MRIPAPERPGRDFALLFIDIARFKMINDTYGHTVGDQFLIEIGNVSNPVCEQRIRGAAFR